MIRVLIVDDSAFFRKLLTDLLTEDEEIVVVGEAKNGEDALRKIPLLKPNVITLDVEMPYMDGITTLKYIVRDYNIPVVMLSSLTTDGATMTIKALEEGAVDFIPKPSNIFNISRESFRDDIINKIKVAAKCNLKSYGISKREKSTIRKLPHIVRDVDFKYIITIGTSTGGPRALQEVIPALPQNIDASILIVQHMPPKFTKSLADRLNSLSEVHVKEGEDGDKLIRGWCYIAPGGYHMKVIKENSDYVIKLDDGNPIKGLRPSVDVLMESVAKIEGVKKLGVIMTGMGSDGADGIVKMKRSSSYILAQDEKSSTVFGMPKAAIRTNCVDKVVSLDRIADEIVRVVGV